jgi:ComF family protein
MQWLSQITDSFLHLVFPHVCEGCGNDVLDQKDALCLKCLSDLPKTNYQYFYNNPVEKIFWGRLDIKHAASQFYFTKESLMQHIMHQIKYRSNKTLGVFMGRSMGTAIVETNRFNNIEALVPLPLFPSKEKKRGYNQAALLCEGMSEIMKIPVYKNVVKRSVHTETQTHKNRVERWQNMEGNFYLENPSEISGKQVLLVDDVVTTGASLEACGQELLKIPGLELSIYTLCYASRI